MSRHGHLKAIREVQNLARRSDLLAQFGSTSPREALEAAATGIEDDDPELREVAADLLEVAALADAAVADETASLLLPRLTLEDDPDALSSVIRVLGRLQVQAAEAGILAHAQDEDDGVRCQVAISLRSFGLSDASLDALCQLSADPDGVVRSWATAALSKGGLDTPAVRDALAARAGDPSREIRYEAIIGLIERGDARAGPMVARELRDPHHEAVMERARDRLGIHGIHLPKEPSMRADERGADDPSRQRVGRILATALVVTLAVLIYVIASQGGTGAAGAR